MKSGFSKEVLGILVTRATIEGAINTQMAHGNGDQVPRSGTPKRIGRFGLGVWMVNLRD